ncbi:MAG: efflux RND transporter periplasmic adaptor subunit [Comamonas sp.]|jgi:macrolide-specific efflux system membrane fusion protein|uniref:efflux RND transporter periplasmic adaptor subunit n=1 Tax=Comamonas sp. TaxID=34028 RepID=UPI00283895D4|nr:efflux RND transporter periplasmic adaptor subunit [Comamonas sp.]MDR0215858.1 efflux RND transporter periplasmic adaptor subunit [Comamonas sp.]
MAARSVRRRFWTGGGKLAQAILILLLPAVGWLLLRPDSPSTWQTVLVSRGDIESSVAAIGTLQPVRSVEVGAQVSGQITRIHVLAGDTVTKGQLLAEIDASVLAATVEAGRAQIASLRAQLEDAQAQAELAVQQDRRQQLLVRDGATRMEDAQIAAATLRSARAKVVQHEATIRQTMASLRADEARLGYTRIYAPIAGVVTGIDVKEGQTLNATYQTPTVLRIADLSRMTVWTDVSEADIRHVKAGQAAYFTTLGGDKRRWPGTVRQVLPAPPVQSGANAASGSGAAAAPTMKAVQYTVLFDVDNADGALMPQMTAQVTVVAAAAKDVLTAPLAAFKPTSDSEVYEVRLLAEQASDQVVEVRRVRLGVKDRLQAEVREGLKEGDRIITGETALDAGPRRFRW